MPEKLAEQWPDATPFFEAFGWTVAHSDDMEADDLLGSYARREEKAKGSALILTGDRDMFQCATDRVSVLYVRTGSQGAAVIGPDEVRARYGVAPELVPDFIALRGDPSDGLPGAKGVGEKTAAELLAQHGSLEAVLAAAIGERRPKLRTALLDDPGQLRAFKEIATLRQIDVKRPRDRRTDWTGAAKAAAERGMNALAKRLEKTAASA
jgi:DNA polymerase-1